MKNFLGEMTTRILKNSRIRLTEAERQILYKEILTSIVTMRRVIQEIIENEGIKKMLKLDDATVRGLMKVNAILSQTAMLGKKFYMNPKDQKEFSANNNVLWEIQKKLFDHNITSKFMYSFFDSLIQRAGGRDSMGPKLFNLFKIPEKAAKHLEEIFKAVSWKEGEENPFDNASTNFGRSNEEGMREIPMGIRRGME